MISCLVVECRPGTCNALRCICSYQKYDAPEPFAYQTSQVWAMIRIRLFRGASKCSPSRNITWESVPLLAGSNPLLWLTVLKVCAIVILRTNKSDRARDARVRMATWRQRELVVMCGVQQRSYVLTSTHDVDEIQVF